VANISLQITAQTTSRVSERALAREAVRAIGTSGGKVESGYNQCGILLQIRCINGRQSFCSQFIVVAVCACLGTRGETCPGAGRGDDRESGNGAA
jgi:hypothetical protein